MKMVEFIVLEKLVLGDRFLNGFTVKMVHRGLAPWDRLNYMMTKYLRESRDKEATMGHDASQCA